MKDNRKILVDPLLVVSSVAVIAAILIRLRFLEFPLERDEGEYAFMGSLILQGIPPYQESYNMKMPGIYAVYAVIMAVFGQSIIGIKLGLMAAVATTTCLVFKIGDQWFGRPSAWIAAASYALVSLLPSVQGMSANAEQFVLPFVLGGVYLLVKHSNHLGAVFLSGILIGTATVVKQHGGVFGLFAGVFLICLIRVPWLGRFYAAICFGAGCLVPLLTVVAVMFLVGTLPNFWFWTVEYALQYASQASLSEGAVNLLRWFEGQWFAAGLLCSFTLIGMLALFRQRPATSMEPILLLIVSMLATVPGFYFRSHYFILAVPSVCLLGGYGIFVVSQWLSARLRLSQNLSAAGLLSLLLLTFLWSSRNLLLLAPMDEVSRLIYGANPFVESREIAQYIRERTSEDERIAIIGSEPQIYFYANRRAATGYIYMYALMEDHPFSQQMQQQVIEEVESVNPNYLVYVNVPNSWLVRPGSDRTIFNWYSQYVQSYDLVGLVALAQDGATYYWDAELPSDVNMMTMGVYIYKRANR